MSDLYGDFSGAGDESIPAVTMSTDPEHMIETVGYGFPVAVAIAPNGTRNLDRVSVITDTETAVFSDVIKEVSGKEYFLQMSEKELARKASGARKKPDEVGERPHDFLASKFSEKISGYVEEVLRDFGSALFFPYMNSEPAETFADQYENLHLVAPDLKVMDRWDSKTWSYRRLEATEANLVPGETFENLEDAQSFLDGKEWDHGAFVSRERGAGGSGSAHVHSQEELDSMYSDADGEVLVQKWLDGAEAAPNVLMMVGGSDVEALVSSDQIIEEGTAYSGNTYPLDLDDSTIDELEAQAEIIGDEMRRDGYRGLTGVDLMVVDGEPYYVEVNPRKNHSTVLKSTMLEELRPEGLPPLPVVEKDVVLGDEDYNLQLWSKNVRESGYTWDMYIFSEPGWFRFSDPGVDTMHDHEYGFGQDSGFVANIPREGAYVPRAYKGIKSSEESLEPQEVNIGRVVTPDPQSRQKMLERYRQGLS
ncbi:MAG: ATP-grasp domain-containing protein [Candidatus Nanohaloarchaea archaeon]